MPLLRLQPALLGATGGAGVRASRSKAISRLRVWERVSEASTTTPERAGASGTRRIRSCAGSGRPGRWRERYRSEPAARQRAPSQYGGPDRVGWSISPPERAFRPACLKYAPSGATTIECRSSHRNMGNIFALGVRVLDQNISKTTSSNPKPIGDKESRVPPRCLDYGAHKPNIKTRVHQEVGAKQPLTEIYLSSATPPRSTRPRSRASRAWTASCACPRNTASSAATGTTAAPPASSTTA